MIPSCSAARPDRDEARVGLVFLPVPEGAPIAGVEGVASQVQVLGSRFREGRTTPSRVLVALAGDSLLPPTVRLGAAPLSGTPLPPPAGMPRLELVSVERKTQGLLMRDVGELRLHGPRGWIGIRLGLESEYGAIDWEWVTASRLWAGPVCESWRVSGYIGIRPERDEELLPGGRAGKPAHLHRHAWLRGDVHLLLFAGGVARIEARHINNRFFDRGGSLKSVTPLIRFSSGAAGPGPDGPWRPVEGTRLAIGPALLNLEDAATLSAAADPAGIRDRAGLVEYRPYSAVCINGIVGHCGARAADGSVLPPGGNDERIIPRGVARTVRLTLSLSDAPPAVAVYAVPAWLHGMGGSLWPDAALPAQGPASRLVNDGARWLRDSMLRNCFDDGSVARGHRWARDGRVGESGWEGETAWALMAAYYLSGDAAVRSDALRVAYNLADVATDHADGAVLMHGHGLDARSLPMQRVLGLIAGYAETADPYLLETAQMVVDQAYWWDRANWPRRSFGRDAAYIRGLIALADVADGAHYLERAREALHRCAACQRADGAFTDQGGTVGLHAMVNEIVKPWMNSIMAEAMADFLDRAGDDVVRESFLRAARWLADAALRDPDGNVYWGYKYRHGENAADPRSPAVPFPPVTGRLPVQPRTKGDNPEIHDGPRASLLRILATAARLTGEAQYTELCFGTLGTPGGGYHGIDQSANKCIEQSAWFDSHLLAAAWTGEGIAVDPVPLAAERRVAVRVATPRGEIGLEASTVEGRLEVRPVGHVPEGVRIVAAPQAPSQGVAGCTERPAPRP